MNKISIPSSILALMFVSAPAVSTAVVAQEVKPGVVNQNRENNQILPYYKLPKDPKTPVIVLNYRGGYTPPKTSDEPTMSILADGTIFLPKKFEQAQEYKGKLTEGELQDLLHFVIGTNEFFKLDNEVVAQKIKDKKEKLRKGGGMIFRMADGATLDIKVSANGKTNQASHYPSGLDESKIPELVHLKAIQKRLGRLMSLTQLGGKEVAVKWLEKANVALLKEHPKVTPLTMDDFQSGVTRADGSVFVNFMQYKQDDNGKPVPGYFTGVTINQPAKGKGEAKINVNFRRPKKK